MFGLPVKTVLICGVCTLALTTFGYGIISYGNMKEQIATQTAIIAAQTSAVEKWEQYSADVNQVLQQEAQGLIQSETRRRKLDDLFATHNLRELALRKPGLISRRVNAATIRTNRVFEQITQPDYNPATE